MKKANCLIAQSGGPTAVINSSLAGIINAALAAPEIDTVYGSLHGIRGVLDHDIMSLNEYFENAPERIEQLSHSPSMFLGSCRHKLPDFTSKPEDYKNIFGLLEEYNIKYFFYIGGNDSMDTILKLSSYANEIHSDIRFMGVPKTIDNDLPVIDHTPGYGSAAKFIATSITEMALDACIYDSPSVYIAEIMGRNAGWLTAAASLARNQYNTAPHLIYLPERTFSNGQFLSDVKNCLEHHQLVVVAVSEGIRYADGTYVSANSTTKDEFGHAKLSGVGKYLESLVKSNIDCKTRAVEFSVLQRCAGHLVSLTDVTEAFTLGEKAVAAILDGCSGEMVYLARTASDAYDVTYHTVPILSVANQEKIIPSSWINKEGNDVTDDFISYAKPLIKGEVVCKHINGIPNYLPVPHLMR